MSAEYSPKALGLTVDQQCSSAGTILIIDQIMASEVTFNFVAPALIFAWIGDRLPCSGNGKIPSDS